MLASLPRPAIPVHTNHHWTYDEYRRFPEIGLTARYPHYMFEILEGELCMAPLLAKEHQHYSRRLGGPLQQWLTRHRCGKLLHSPLDVVLSEDTVVRPDLVFLAKGHLSLMKSKVLHGTPDLLVEIVSPYSAYRDRNTKIKLYSQFKTPFYWIVDPEHATLEEYELDGKNYQAVREWHATEVFTPRVFPGLQLELQEILIS